MKRSWTAERKARYQATIAAKRQNRVKRSAVVTSPIDQAIHEVQVRINRLHLLVDLLEQFKR